MSETSRGVSLEVSKWLTKIDGLPEVAERLKMCQIENRSFDYVIPKFDRKETFLFCDPPYEHAMRTGTKDYKHELSVEQHRLLAELLNRFKGKEMICGYDSKLMQELYPSSKWIAAIEPDRVTNLGKKKLNREMVWMNFYEC
jgi:DNA adenine methylase